MLSKLSQKCRLNWQKCKFYPVSPNLWLSFFRVIIQHLLDESETVWGNLGHILWHLFCIELPQRHFFQFHKQSRHFFMNSHSSLILQLWEVKILLNRNKIKSDQKPHNKVSYKHFHKCKVFIDSLCIKSKFNNWNYGIHLKLCPL